MNRVGTHEQKRGGHGRTARISCVSLNAHDMLNHDNACVMSGLWRATVATDSLVLAVLEILRKIININQFNVFHVLPTQ